MAVPGHLIMRNRSADWTTVRALMAISLSNLRPLSKFIHHKSDQCPVSLCKPRFSAGLHCAAQELQETVADLFGVEHSRLLVSNPIPCSMVNRQEAG